MTAIINHLDWKQLNDNGANSRALRVGDYQDPVGSATI